VLRTASIFGEVFWPTAVASLLGGGAECGALVDRLVQQEALVRRPESRFPGEPELAFRHALLAEGAYAMLTEEDRVRGHRLAGEWLEQRGEGALRVLAEHFERGREPARAASLYHRAAEQAGRWGDLETAIACARRGLACAPPDELRLALLTVLWASHLWTRDLANRDIRSDAEQMMRLATPGSGAWARGALLKLFAVLAVRDLEEFTAMLDDVRSVEPLADAATAVADALSQGITYLVVSGHAEIARSFLGWLEAIVEPVRERDPRARGLLHLTRSLCSVWGGDPWSGLRWAEAALESFQQGGAPLDIAHAHLQMAWSLWFLGAFAQAERVLREAPPCAGEEILAAHRSLYLAAVLLEKGALEDARLVVEGMIEVGRARRAAMLEGLGRKMLAETLYLQGAVEAAEREALTAREQLASMPNMQTPLITLLAAIRLAQGRVAEALAAANEAMARYEALAMFGCKGSQVRLVHAEVLMAAGDREAALAAMAEARARLLESAEKIGDPELRRSFLEDIRENARTLALARAWLGEA
jgi:tetratricopeptide (TPR) repeat protein